MFGLLVLILLIICGLITTGKRIGGDVWGYLTNRNDKAGIFIGSHCTVYDTKTFDQVIHYRKEPNGDEYKELLRGDIINISMAEREAEREKYLNGEDIHKTAFVVDEQNAHRSSVRHYPIFWRSKNQGKDETSGRIYKDVKTGKIMGETPIWYSGSVFDYFMVYIDRKTGKIIRVTDAQIDKWKRKGGTELVSKQLSFVVNYLQNNHINLIYDTFWGRWGVVCDNDRDKIEKDTKVTMITDFKPISGEPIYTDIICDTVWGRVKGGSNEIW